jgi:hypothetical protein
LIFSPGPAVFTGVEERKEFLRAVLDVLSEPIDDADEGAQLCQLCFNICLMIRINYIL